MTIAYRSNSSGIQAGTTSVLYRAPSTVEAGDAILWFAASKYPPVVPATPSGLTLVAHAAAASGGAEGADTGNVTGSAFWREADGTEDAGTETRSISGGNSITSRSLGYGRDAGSGWLLAYASGEQTTAANAWDVTTGSIDLAAGDVLVMLVAKNSDQDLTHSAHTLTASGITFGSVTVRNAPVGTTNGDDCALEITEIPVTAGSGTVSVRVQINMSGSAGMTAGTVLLVRLREDVAAAYTHPTLSNARMGSLTSTGGVPMVDYAF